MAAELTGRGLLKEQAAIRLVAALSFQQLLEAAVAQPTTVRHHYVSGDEGNTDGVWRRGRRTSGRARADSNHEAVLEEEATGAAGATGVAAAGQSALALHAASCFGGSAGVGQAVRHPELKLNIPPQLFCMSWCPDFEFWGTYVGWPGGR